jgi:hypothetical protein
MYYFLLKEKKGNLPAAAARGKLGGKLYIGVGFCWHIWKWWQKIEFFISYKNKAPRYLADPLDYFIRSKTLDLHNKTLSNIIRYIYQTAS